MTKNSQASYLRLPIITTFGFPGSFPVGSSKFADTRGWDPRRWLSRRRLIETSWRAFARFDCFRFRVAKHSFNVVCAKTAEITGHFNKTHVLTRVHVQVRRTLIFLETWTKAKKQLWLFSMNLEQVSKQTISGFSLLIWIWFWNEQSCPF